MQSTDRHDNLRQRQVFISCVVPIYNEESVVGQFLPHLAAQLEALTDHYEIIVVNDGSKDNSAAEIRRCLHNPAIKLLNFSRNFGKEIALTAGLDHSKGDVVILIDADFEHPVELIPTFLTEWANGHEMVYGIHGDRSQERWFRKVFTPLFYKIMANITACNFPRNAGDFRLLDRKVVTSLNQFDERERLMKGLYAWVGFRSTGIPFVPPRRAGGRSSWNPLKLFNLALTGIISFSDVPLRLCSLLGFMISLFSVFYGAFIIVDMLIHDANLPRFATLVVAITFLGGVQLISIGILGEYIARIFTEVKRRPKYIIETTHGFDDRQDPL